MAIWPFKKDSFQKAVGFVLSAIGVLFVAIGLNKPAVDIFGVQLLGVGFVVFVVGLVYLIEVIFR